MHGRDLIARLLSIILLPTLRVCTTILIRAKHMPSKQNIQPRVARRRRSKCMRPLRQVRIAFFQVWRRLSYYDVLEVIVWLPPYKVDECALSHLIDEMWKRPLIVSRMTIKQRPPQTSTSQTTVLELWYEGKLRYRTELNLPPAAGHDNQLSFPSTPCSVPQVSEQTSLQYFFRL